MSKLFKVSFTGHRPHKLGDSSIVKARIREFLVSLQSRHSRLLVISGGALGVDQLAVEVCIELHIPFALCLPFPFRIFSARWSSPSRSHARSLFQHARLTYHVQSEFSMAGYQLRNELMVNHCDLLCAVFNGSPGGTANCVRYAQSVGRDIHFIHP